MGAGQLRLLSLLWTALAPLLIGGGATGILVLFKEHLPELLYLVLLVIIWVVFVFMLIRLALRLAFGDWIDNLRKWMKRRKEHSAKLETAKEWRAKWSEFWDLISDIIETGWEPSEDHTSKHIRLHFWFGHNRSKFLPIWHSFQRSRTEAAFENEFDSTVELRYKVFRENYKDPFSYFYEPVTVEQLRRILYHSQSGEIELVLMKLLELTDELIDWLSVR